MNSWPVVLVALEVPVSRLVAAVAVVVGSAVSVVLEGAVPMVALSVVPDMDGCMTGPQASSRAPTVNSIASIVDFFSIHTG